MLIRPVACKPRAATGWRRIKEEKLSPSKLNQLDAATGLQSKGLTITTLHLLENRSTTNNKNTMSKTYRSHVRFLNSGS